MKCPECHEDVPAEKMANHLMDHFRYAAGQWGYCWKCWCGNDEPFGTDMRVHIEAILMLGELEAHWLESALGMHG